ncbi:unnamed protein product [Clonostachys rhizophaga]|uniref:Uncharacterized protein n=1 Tax=Clonostachys rhizophaga TaxID=160324 RepID=A0A9N9VZ37_9HYPO|nr:unnamed protein product [Clonostachys rhizophaga]
MFLIDLPNEILRAICEDQRLSQKDLYSITRTCSKLFHISVPYLYRINYLSQDGSAVAWAIKEKRMEMIQRALDSGLDVVRPHHLRLAIEHGPGGLFTKLWEHKAQHGDIPDPNTYKRDESLICIATCYGRHDAVKTLLETGKISTNDRNDALCHAVYNGTPFVLPRVHGASAVTQNYRPIGSLRTAAEFCFERSVIRPAGKNLDDYLETARLLLHHGLEIEHRDEGGRTALHGAVMIGDCQMVELLASYGADPTARVPYSGWTTLHTASLYGCQLEMFELLLRLGADASAVDDERRSPLFWMASLKEPAPVVKALLESGASINADEDRHTPLHEAAARGSVKLVEALVEHGADVNATDRQRATPFYYAVRHAAPSEVIKFLVDHGARTTMTGKLGQGAMLSAAQKGTADTMRAVLENVANLKEVMGWVDLREYKEFPQSLLHVAVIRESQEMIDVIIQFGGHEGYLAKDRGGRLHQGAITGDFALMQSVLDEGASLDADRNRFGRTALVVAIHVGATSSIDWLLKKGAKANARDKTDNKSTPLHHATDRNAIAAVELLLKHGARVGLKNGGGETALHIASWSGAPEIAKMLLESGASIWDQDDEGATPVEYAAIYHRKTVLPLLSEKVGKSRISRRRFREVTSRYGI